MCSDSRQGSRPRNLPGCQLICTLQCQSLSGNHTRHMCACGDSVGVLASPTSHPTHQHLAALTALGRDLLAEPGNMYMSEVSGWADWKVRMDEVSGQQHVGCSICLAYFPLPKTPKCRVQHLSSICPGHFPLAITLTLNRTHRCGVDIPLHSHRKHIAPRSSQKKNKRGLA